MPALMNSLLATPLSHWTNLEDLPTKGIYVFYENARPIYVGRTNRMKNRIKEHGRRGSDHNKAPFAFNIAKKEAEHRGINTDISRGELERDELFKDLFYQAKQRVSNMHLRFVEINNPIMQTLFEVYASIELKTTEFNSFDNH
jgi:hypothetical protein